MAAKKDPRLARAGVSGYNKPKATPDLPQGGRRVGFVEWDRAEDGEAWTRSLGEPLPKRRD